MRTLKISKVTKQGILEEMTTGGFENLVNK